MSTPLDQLIRQLDLAVTLPKDAIAGAVTAALGTAVSARDWLGAEHLQPCREQYVRHVLHADPLNRYTLMALVWDRGQHSPIHAHHTWCGVAVYSGELCETFYAEEAAAAAPRALRSTTRAPGTLSFDDGGCGVHRLANASDGIGVSLHVYGIGASGITNGINRVLG